MKPVLSIVLMVFFNFQRGYGLSVLREDGGSGVSCFGQECNDENSSIKGITYEGEHGVYVCVDYGDRLSTTYAPTTAAPTTAAPTTTAPTTADPTTAAPTTAAPTTTAPTTADPTTAAPTTAAPTTTAPTTAAPTTAAPTTAAPTTTAPTTADPTTAAPTTAAPTTTAQTTADPTTAAPTTAAPTTTVPTTAAPTTAAPTTAAPTTGAPTTPTTEKEHFQKILRLKNVFTKGNLMNENGGKQCALKPKEGNICDVIKEYYNECYESEPSSGNSISVGFSLFVILVSSVLYVE